MENDNILYPIDLTLFKDHLTQSIINILDNVLFHKLATKNTQKASNRTFFFKTDRLHD